MRIAYSDITKTGKFDAGIAHEYLAQTYGSVLTFGGSLRSYEQAESIARRIARNINSTTQHVLSSARTDYENANA